MSDTLEYRYVEIDATALAVLVDSQPDAWWSVDGDLLLTSLVDFPCPSDELSKVLRGIAKKIRIFDPRREDPAGELTADELDWQQMQKMAETNSKSGSRTYLLSWADIDGQWLLIEEEEPTTESESLE